MQNASTSSSQGQPPWSSNPAYSNHQRTSSNPRSYPEEPNRDAGMYNQYGSYPQANYDQSYNFNYNNPRRTSNPKSPPPSAPANPSPSSHYPVQYPNSAPPVNMQPQTAHPYGGYYNSYYDQSQYYPPNYQRPSGSSTTPTMAQTSVMDRPDYSPSNYPGYDARNASGRPPYYPQMQQPMQGGYNWQYPGYGYPPVPAPVPQPPAPAAATAQSAPGAVPSKKGKKDKKDKEEVLGKRSVDEKDSEPEEKAGKKKKGKKEEEKEKPVPKAPAKSHLHPPRQAQSAWQLFFTDELNKAKEAAQQGNSPGGTPHSQKLNVAQIAKDAGAAYANLNEEQKNYYAGKVQESKEQYAKDLAVWQATLTPEDIRLENAFRAQQRKDGKSRKGNLKDPNAPKKPLSAYFLFLKSIREDDKIREAVWGNETETTKQSVLAAERWRGLTDDEKKPYLSQAETDKQEYEAARKIYEDNAAARARGEEVPEPTPSKPALTFNESPEETLFPSDPFGIDLANLDAPDTQGQWDDLHHLMGTEKKKESKPEFTEQV